ncbi:MAG: hypothetical protein H0X31_18895 [Nostocaceae cyanobacterium]|nr:hypothetical protein [Nostocaceae cyanobacterium]
MLIIFLSINEVMRAHIFQERDRGGYIGRSQRFCGLGRRAIKWLSDERSHSHNLEVSHVMLKRKSSP